MPKPDDDAPRFVMIVTRDAQVCYPEADFINAFSDAFLGRLASAIPQGSTARHAARAVRGLKRDGQHKKVLRAAVDRLQLQAESVGVEEVQRIGGSVVATFPN